MEYLLTKRITQLGNIYHLRRNIELYFLELKLLYFGDNFIEICYPASN